MEGETDVDSTGKIISNICTRTVGMASEGGIIRRKGLWGAVA